MLIRFRTANHRSINDAVDLVFRTPATDGDGSRAPGATVAAIYGANASGKSNVLDALLQMRAAVIGSHSKWRPSMHPPRSPFALDPSSAREPSLFEVDFTVGETRYQYGFTIGPESFLDEWLYTYPEVRRRTLFERTGQDFRFGRGLKGPNRTIADLVRPNSLYLSAAVSNNHEELRPVYSWFEQMLFAGLPAFAPNVTNVTEQMLAGDDREEVRKLLAIADLGIIDIHMREEEVDPDLAKAVKGLLKTIESKSDDAPATPFEVPVTQTIVMFEHTGTESAQIGFNEESRGTQMWFAHIGPVLLTLRRGGILIVDELDASLHPRLSSEIVRLFSDPDTNPNGAQLVFSTHDTTLLGSLIPHSLDREDVWFTEKDSTGATLLYPLSEFKPRKGEALERRYLEGRYGAIPIVDLSVAARQLTE